MEVPEKLTARSVSGVTVSKSKKYANVKSRVFNYKANTRTEVHSAAPISTYDNMSSEKGGYTKSKSILQSEL